MRVTTHVLGDQGVKRLSGLLDGFVESFRGAVALGAEDLVLGLEDTLDGTHKDTTLTGKVRVDLLLAVRRSVMMSSRMPLIFSK